MAVDAGAGRDEANLASTRVHKIRHMLMFKVELTTKKSLGTMNYAKVQG